MNKYKTLIITTIYLLVIETVFNILLYQYINISNLFFYLLQSITISSVINIISSLFKEKINKIVLISLVFIITLFYISQFVHYSFYDCFFSIYSLVNGSQVFGFIPAIIKIIFNNIQGFLLLIILLITTIIALVKTKQKKFPKKRILLAIIIINLFITTLCIYIPNNNLYSRKNLLTKTNVETENVQSFGLPTSMIIDIKRYITKPQYELYIEESNKSYNKEKYNIKDIEFNIKTDDKDLKKLSNYLKNSTPTNKNEYTGIFKDKNLIFITAESFSFSLIDKDITPTLYKLQNEGLNFSNFYTPIYYASTSDGEYTNLTGLLPKEGTWSYISSKDNYFPYSYANIFKKQNYSLNGYHNGVYTFYDRDKVMPKLGYNFTACGNGLEKYINCNLWPQSDDEMITNTFKDYKDSNKFHTYYMSISGHLYHNFKNNDMAKKYKNEINSLNYTNSTKAYISANIDLDKALEHLLNNLQKENKLEDTVIVLVPDHYPYGLSKKEYSDLRKLDTPYAKHKSGLIIYNPSIESKTIDKYASNIDVLPTLLNMFGIDYDSRLLIGKDIMSNTQGIVIFNDHSFLTKEGFYNEKTNKFSNKKTSKSYIKEKQKETFNKINASSLILEKNYYKYIK